MFVDPLDQGFLAGKMPVDRRMGDADALGKLAGLALEAMLGEEADRLFQDELFALVRPHVLFGTPRFFSATFAFKALLLIRHACPDLPCPSPSHRQLFPIAIPRPAFETKW
jgi:hypothetical protein